ncbi:hypothetical protein [Marinibacterium profundimaris]|uniref:Uncharacterized protein n=1 Tax=Marinibacterium profundimaris TaxID=1679460 RepID=A0A225NL42_9RHOB|nr:hypothetical protein [Marinibacterium profundimaris]OWU70502.1 hypothetical protein ATO3_19735 [Marinibacterium profundimaris]
MSDNCETNGFKGERPIEDDPLFFWRLNDDFKLPDAAILITGNDPSKTEIQYNENEGYAHYNSDGSYMRAQKRDYEGFEAVFGALKSAIRRGTLQAKLTYQGGVAAHGATRGKNFRVVAAHDFWHLIRETSDNPFAKFEDVEIEVDVDWDETTVDADDLKRWLRSKGFTGGFFFPNQETFGGDDFLDAGHEHFSSELALAVNAWRALLPERKFRGGVRAAIDAWIVANPDVWQGDEPLSGSAKERITTLVNWNKSGGAPKSGG